MDPPHFLLIDGSTKHSIHLLQLRLLFYKHLEPIVAYRSKIFLIPGVENHSVKN